MSQSIDGYQRTTWFLYSRFDISSKRAILRTKGEATEVCGAVAVARDVTERVQQEPAPARGS